MFARDLGEVLVECNLDVGEVSVLICGHDVVYAGHSLTHGGLEVGRHSRVLILSDKFFPHDEEEVVGLVVDFKESLFITGVQAAEVFKLGTLRS